MKDQSKYQVGERNSGWDVHLEGKLVARFDREKDATDWIYLEEVKGKFLEELKEVKLGNIKPGKINF